MKLFDLFKSVPQAPTPAPEMNLRPFVQHYGKTEPIRFKEEKTGGWVSFGEDNQFPEELLNLSESSAIHNGILVGKSYLIAGDEFLVGGVPLPVWSKESPDLDAVIELNSFINNSYADNWYDLKSKFATDYTISGAYCAKITWSTNFSRIVKVEYVPFHWVRAGIAENGQINKYYIAETWKGRKIEAEEIQAFNINSHLPDGKLPENYDSVEEYPYDYTQLLYVKNNFPGWQYYGRPNYIGALNAIKTSASLNEFYLSSVETGFTPSMIISYPQTPSSEEQGNAIRKQLERQFTNKGIGRKLAVFFSPNKDSQPTFTPLDVKNLDAQMLQLQQEVNVSIVTGHSVTSPELVGVSVPGQLGSGSFEEKYSLFKLTVIDKDRDVIERTLNMLLSINGFTETVKIQDKQI